MANAAAIIGRINRAISRVSPVSQTVYKRLVTTTGDALIGKVTSTKVDTILSPQPIAIETGRQKLSGERDNPTTVTTPNGNRITSDDYVFTLSSSSITLAEIENKNLIFVLKEGNVETTLYVMDFSRIEYQGTILSYKLFLRSVQSKTV